MTIWSSIDCVRHEVVFDHRDLGRVGIFFMISNCGKVVFSLDTLVHFPVQSKEKTGNKTAVVETATDPTGTERMAEVRLGR